MQEATNYREVHSIYDRDHIVVAIITCRVNKEGKVVYSCAFMREYDHQGVRKRTAWMHERHLEGVKRIIPQVDAWLQEHRATGSELEAD